jgi:hypothetical protein
MLTQNPDMLKSAAEMMRSMPQEQLQAALAQSGAALPPGVDPSMLTAAAEAMAKMPKEQMQVLAQQMAALQGAGSSGSGAAGGSGSAAAVNAAGIGDAAAAAAVSSSMGAAGGALPTLTPEMAQMASRMFASMKPEDMAAAMTAVQAGGSPGSVPSAQSAMGGCALDGAVVEQASQSAAFLTSPHCTALVLLCSVLMHTASTVVAACAAICALQI